MLTPLLMLLLLTLPWLATRTLRRDTSPAALQTAAATGAGLLFLFTASGHFLQAAPMVQMLPPWVPAREELVFATGLLEIAIALAFFVPRTRNAAAWSAIAVLVLFFPANIYAAFTQAPMGGHAWGPVYLLVRAPMQLFIVWWIAALVRRQGALRVKA